MFAFKGKKCGRSRGFGESESQLAKAEPSRLEKKGGRVGTFRIWGGIFNISSGKGEKNMTPMTSQKRRG